MCAAAIGMVAAAASCTPTKKGEYAKGSATVFCDDGFKTILDEEIAVFEYSYPEASIIPFYVGEKEAVDTLLANKTQAIIITHELTKEQIKYMKAKHKRVVRTNCIAVDAVASQVYPSRVTQADQEGSVVVASAQIGLTSILDRRSLQVRINIIIVELDRTIGGIDLVFIKVNQAVVALDEAAVGLS